MEVEAAFVVLDHGDHPRGASSPVDFVYSLDHQVDSCRSDCAFWHRGLVRDALGSFSCGEIRRWAEDRLTMGIRTIAPCGPTFRAAIYGVPVDHLKQDVNKCLENELETGLFGEPILGAQDSNVQTHLTAGIEFNPGPSPPSIPVRLLPGRRRATRPVFS